MKIMKSIYQIRAIGVVLLLTAACSGFNTSSLTKAGYISNYEIWINKLKAEYKTYKEAEWTISEREFKRFSETEYNKFREEFTVEDRRKVDMLTGQYFAILAKYKADKLKEELRSIMNQAEGMYEELQKE